MIKLVEFGVIVPELDEEEMKEIERFRGLDLEEYYRVRRGEEVRLFMEGLKGKRNLLKKRLEVYRDGNRILWRDTVLEKIDKDVMNGLWGLLDIVLV